MNVSVADKLDKIADFLEDKGWTQGRTCLLGRMCLLGAAAALFTWEEQNAPLEYLRRYLHTYNLAGWNDEPYHTQEKVVATLRSAAEKARTIDIF